ncbi:50S ribosome-binding GTPase [Candidatus Pacearchaeota archaeon]|nr:50S ribosome-binding GTPase [Candidatus Pacearchaeota archaeon]
MGFWPLAERVLREANIILLVGDARMPLLSKNSEIERKSEILKKPLVYVYNKIDLLSNNSLIDAKNNYKEAFFVSASKNLGIKGLRKHLQITAKKLGIKEPKIGVVGYPNVGKSAVINALARRAKAEIADMPGTTRGVQWIKAGGLDILDSPGVIPYKDKSSDLVLIGSKSPDKISNPDKVAFEIIQLFISKDKKKLEEFYGINFPPVEEHGDILIKIGRRRGFLKKGGEVDETKAAISLIRDWQKGRLRF